MCYYHITELPALNKAFSYCLLFIELFFLYANLVFIPEFITASFKTLYYRIIENEFEYMG